MLSRWLSVVCIEPLCDVSYSEHVSILLCYLRHLERETFQKMFEKMIWGRREIVMRLCFPFLVPLKMSVFSFYKCTFEERKPASSHSLI